MITYDENKGRLIRWISGYRSGRRAGQAMWFLKTNLSTAKKALQELESIGLLVKDGDAWSMSRNNANQFVFTAPFYAVYSTVRKTRGVIAPEIAAINGLPLDDTEAILSYLIDLDLVDYKTDARTQERAFFYCYDD